MAWIAWTTGMNARLSLCVRGRVRMRVWTTMSGRKSAMRRWENGPIFIFKNNEKRSRINLWRSVLILWCCATHWSMYGKHWCVRVCVNQHNTVSFVKRKHLHILIIINYLIKATRQYNPMKWHHRGEGEGYCNFYCIMFAVCIWRWFHLY